MQPIEFELHKLGWKSFEDLIACVLKEEMGQTFQVFADGRDGGRDGAFWGQWNSIGSAQLLVGSFAVQCKHTSKAGTKLGLSVVEDEIPKISSLAERGLADNYLLFTNCSVGAETAAELEAIFRAAGAKQAKIFGAEWLNQTISTKPSLRRLVPRLYGLGDLTQIVTHQAYRQARSVLDSIVPDLECFVPTDAYRKCAHALKEYGFVMLIGEPASGKSMIANLLALSAADEWNLQTLILNCPEDLDKKWNADEPKQFFWVDDAFGSNHCDFDRVQEWNQRLAQLKAAIHVGARVIFTSRTYIFRAAQARLNSHKFELIKDSRVTIEVERLSQTEKAMILYNHLKLGRQSRAFKKSVKKFLPSVVHTSKFLPEIARRFGNPKFTKNVGINSPAIERFFTHPVDVMADIVQGLANGEKAALALVYASGGSLEIPLQDQNPLVHSTIASMRSSVGEVKESLSALNDSMLRVVTVSDLQFWQFRHPTIRDAFASDVANNPELVEIYLSGVRKERLMEEISCGDMKIEGVKLIVPPSLYRRVVAIIAPDGALAALSRSVIYFLAERCSTDFLQLFFEDALAISVLEKHIIVTNRFDPALKLLGRLNKEGLVSEEIRLMVIERIQRMADADFSECFVDRLFVGTLLSASENIALLNTQKDRLFSSRELILEEIEENWVEGEDIDDAFSLVRSLIDRFEEENEAFVKEPGYEPLHAAEIETFRDEIHWKANSLRDRQSTAETYEELETKGAGFIEVSVNRDIFDDVDE